MERNGGNDPGRRPRLVVVGNGMAGMRAVEELISPAPERFDITVFGAEAARVLRSHPALLGARRRKGLDDIVINPPLV